MFERLEQVSECVGLRPGQVRKERPQFGTEQSLPGMERCLSGPTERDVLAAPVAG